MKSSVRSIRVYVALGLVALVAVFILWNMTQSTSSVSVTACSESTRPLTLLAFGDSLVEGVGAQTEGGFVTLLSQDLGVPIQNFGLSGDTTTSALTRSRKALTQNPDIVIVLLGGNDALGRSSVAVVEQNLTNLVEQIIAAGAHGVLLGVPGGLPFSDPYPAMYERVAARPQVTYVPNVLSGIFGKGELMSDQIHPNELGYQRIAERVAPAVREVCAGLSPRE